MPSLFFAPYVNLYTAEQVRELDRCAIEDFGTPGIVLMKRAGQAILDEVLERFSDVSHITIFCGAGNNGGDGYIVAGLAKQKNIEVRVVETSAAKLKGDAAKARSFACQQNVEPVDAQEWLKESEVSTGTIIVDALLGTGFSGELRAPYEDLIISINQSGVPVVSADIPSGLAANTGATAHAGIRIESEQAVQADATVTFIGMKIGLFTGQGRAFSGDIVFDDLEVAPEIYEQSQPLATLLDYDELMELLSERKKSNHKGDHGHVVIVGGDVGNGLGFGGAPLMAAEAAARVGAGLVSVVTRPENRAAMMARHPEIMVCDADDVKAVENLLSSAAVIVVGPGLGTHAWGQKLLQFVLTANKPMVIDADALNLLATGQFSAYLPLKDSVITPHPGEAGRLLDLTAQEINQDRVAAVEQLQKRFSSVVLLKGSGTLIASEAGLSLCPYGNPGMGSGGMGDVLSGVIGGLMAQGADATYAAKLGACVHAYAADCIAEEQGERGLMATDLINVIRRLINGI